MLKTITLTATFSFFAFFGFSQAPSIHLSPYKKKNETVIDYSKPFVWRDTTNNKLRKTFEQLARIRLAEIQGQYSHTTPIGKVYVLTPDNMPCLVPYKNANALMPGSIPKILIPEQMPNAVPKKKIIPDNK